MGRTKKKYEELTIIDDFMFGKVMRDPKHCKKLLEIILDVKIRKIIFLDDQKTMNPDYISKGIRMDIYVEDDANTVYAVEMQTRNTGDLTVRSRYYQAVLDINMIEKGLDYEKLRKSYIIFICTFDQFNRGRHIYHFENRCREDPSLCLEDGTEKIFLNTKGTMNDVDDELRSLLDYFESQVPQDTFTGKLDKAVTAARSHKDWRREYMVIERMMMDSRREGLKKGLAKGELKDLVGLICRKLSKGKTPEMIAEELDEDAGKVQHICDVAAKYAPNYNVEKITRKLMADNMSGKIH